MIGQPLWVIPWEGNALNRKSLRPLKLSRENRYAACWVLIAREVDGAALPRWVYPIASLRRARLGRLNLLTVPQGLTPHAKAEECLAAGEAEGILTVSAPRNRYGNPVTFDRELRPGAAWPHPEQ